MVHLRLYKAESFMKKPMAFIVYSASMLRAKLEAQAERRYEVSQLKAPALS